MNANILKIRSNTIQCIVLFRFKVADKCNQVMNDAKPVINDKMNILFIEMYNAANKQFEKLMEIIQNTNEFIVQISTQIPNIINLYKDPLNCLDKDWFEYNQSTNDEIKQLLDNMEHVVNDHIKQLMNNINGVKDTFGNKPSDASDRASDLHNISQSEISTCKIECFPNSIILKAGTCVSINGKSFITDEDVSITSKST